MTSCETAVITAEPETDGGRVIFIKF